MKQEFLMTYKKFNRWINTNKGCYQFLFDVADFNKKYSGLPTHLSIDHISCYERYGKGNQKFIAIQNNYDEECFDWQKGLDVLLMTISDNPQMFLKNSEIKIKDEDIEIIKQFIVKYKNELEQFADQTGDYHQWYGKNFTGVYVPEMQNQ